jgi:hypothetical protein
VSAVAESVRVRAVCLLEDRAVRVDDFVEAWEIGGWSSSRFVFGV